MDDLFSQQDEEPRAEPAKEAKAARTKRPPHPAPKDAPAPMDAPKAPAAPVSLLPEEASLRNAEVVTPEAPPAPEKPESKPPTQPKAARVKPEIASEPIAVIAPVADAATPSPTDRMPALIAAFQSDRDCLERTFAAPFAPRRLERMRAFMEEWKQTADALPFAELSHSDRADALLFRALLAEETRRLDEEARRFAEVESLIPFAPALLALDERRRALQDVEPRAAAELLDGIRAEIASLRDGLTSGVVTVEPHRAGRTARLAGKLRDVLESWHGFYHGYDPVFDWWMETPYPALNTALEEYARFLRETIAGVTGDAILGEPIGRDALRAQLRHAQVPYEPEELIAAADAEMAWCRAELVRASNEMGCGDDWRAAMERVKDQHVAPGAQPALVRDLAFEAIEYVERHDLVTVPAVARECWRMEMMSAERQKMSPFFLGGETIIVSFPTREMEQERKRMSLRGNNRAFSRATVHHELIPGHHLQMYSMERHRPYRRVFRTPFWIEGWTLHWEMLLWEREFGRTPEERIGMLFWRQHRAARVIFSLKFHLGEMTAPDCVELLVREACHERDTALAEVRRSFEGDYPPLYQAAYLVGAWQMHALYRELVGTGRMTDREFHDAVLRENCIPIPTLRVLLTGQELTPDFTPDWRFYPLPAPDGNRAS